MNIFLSYAEEDRVIAEAIVDRLDAAGHVVFNWLDPAQRGKQIINHIETGIMQAHAFIALLSSSYLTSYWCKQELGIAANCEKAITERDRDARFIYVVAAEDVPPDKSGVLGTYDAMDMTGRERWQPALEGLVGRLERAERLSLPPTTASAALSVAPGGDAGSQAPNKDGKPAFRNRDEEVRKVLDGLGNTAGSHFWYVVAPPQLGKTWLLQHIHDRLAESEPVPWAVTLADLREQPAVARGDLRALLEVMFGHASPPGEEPMRIAQEMLKAGRPHLCLLDSAELLSREMAADLRVCLSEIHRHVAEQDGRFAFIAASRRDDEWRGVAPARFIPLPLTEFTTDVVQGALRDLASDMGRPMPEARIREHAVRVHGVTEGLPALLVRCLRWVRDEQWVAMDRLDKQQLFENFAAPYVRQHLLTPTILLPEAQQGDGKLAALIQAYRVLAPYRLFTFSHLRHYQENDSDFRAALDSAEWSLDDLWPAIRGTALLKRPLNDPWKEIHPPIRRLLYRYFYRTDDQRIEAQCEARKFVETWSDGLAGIEQAVGLVECLWHEAAALRMREPTKMEERLIESARALSRSLRAFGVSLPELREYAAERMRSDGEFEDAVGDGDGLLSRLAGILVDPGGS